MHISEERLRSIAKRLREIEETAGALTEELNAILEDCDHRRWEDDGGFLHEIRKAEPGEIARDE